ncbi:hypothetical protein PF005_g31282 [Phytophthora fragariae]|nr:hypothetical protein PF010_g30261 [Phytophthora fragariae]KAE9061254.1 hypothetical protein PF007_g30324 [Phytophthora fragariae]KAE9161358.1 hypothetical protein PF005_g31282 [Phytophthora fragariae]
MVLSRAAASVENGSCVQLWLRYEEGPDWFESFPVAERPHNTTSSQEEKTMQAHPGSGGAGFRRLDGLSALLDGDSDSSEERLIMGIPVQSEVNTPDEGVTSGAKATTEPASSK